jgi:hydroxypyruvate isomerase
LDAAAYDGYIGLEYKPLPGAPMARNFGWLPQELRSSAR